LYIVNENKPQHRMKKILYIDMDGVLVDTTSAINRLFRENPDLYQKYKHYPDRIPHLFEVGEPIDGAIRAVNLLYQTQKYDMFIATSAPWRNPNAANHKKRWIENYFGDMFYKRMFITHRKDLLMGDYLIDDRLKNGAGEFGGKLIRFGWDYEEQRWNEYPNWDSVLKILL